MRPHWWAVLAVSLSLLALVAAATSEHSGHGKGRDTAASRNRKATGIPTTAPSTTTSTATADPTLPARNMSSAATAPTVSPGTSGSGGHLVTTPATTAMTAPTTTGATTSTTTSTTGSTTTSTTGSAPAQPAPQTRSGNLQQPYDATANEAFTGAGAMRISASWSPTDSMSLSVSCPDGSQTAEGTTSAAVVILDADGPCNLTLKILLVQYDAISYTLTIAPAGG